MEKQKKKFLWIVFITLIFFNLARVIGWEYFSQAALWERIVYDNLHHYQLGILFLIIALFLRSLPSIRNTILALGTAMIIDESMYVFYPLYWRFNHYTWEGIVFEFIVFGILSAVIVKFGKKTL